MPFSHFAIPSVGGIHIPRMSAGCDIRFLPYLPRNRIHRPHVVIVVENRGVAGVPVVPQSSPLQAPQLPDHAIPGLLAPKLARVPLVPSRR